MPAVTLRKRSLLAAALGLCMAHPPAAWSAEPPAEPGRFGFPAGEPLPALGRSANQQTADTIAEHLRQSGQLRRYSVDVTFRDRTAELSGAVADQAQREEVLRIAQGVPGVERVVDRMTLSGGVVPARAAAEVPPPAAPPGAAAAVPPAGGPLPEPVPVFQAPQGAPYALNPPRMPPYAWPTYAPYNNYSRVAYPEAYPYNAWPFIGPCYPFPKVPLGWRSVKLEWDDGYWWFSKVATKYDWWRLRYW
jgi:hypothetical protein